MTRLAFSSFRQCADFAQAIATALLFGLALGSTAFAGDVLVEVVGNDVTVTGSGQPDVLEFIQAVDGTLEVFAYDTTTINGGLTTFDTGLAAGNVNNLTFDMKGGDDQISAYFDAAGITGDFDSRTGPGNDLLIIQLLEVAGDVKTNMGGGNDAFDFSNTTVFGNVTHVSGAGNDFNYIGYAFGSEIEPIFVAGDMSVRCGGGNDFTSYDAVVSILGNLTQSCGGGNDTLFFSAQVGGTMDYNGGGANDEGYFGDSGECLVEGQLTIRAGGGSDYFEFGVANAAISATGVAYTGGNGRDTVNIGALATFQGTITASMGRGNDTLNSSELTSYAVPGNLNGGTGIDDCNPDPDDLTALGFIVTNFEN